MLKRGLPNLFVQKKLTPAKSLSSINSSHVIGINRLDYVQLLKIVGKMLEVAKEGAKEKDQTVYKKSLGVLTSEINKLCQQADAFFYEENEMEKTEGVLLEAIALVDGISTKNLRPSFEEEEREIFSKPYSRYANFIYKTERENGLEKVEELLRKAFDLNENDQLAENIKEEMEYSYPRPMGV